MKFASSFDWRSDTSETMWKIFFIRHLEEEEEEPGKIQRIQWFQERGLIYNYLWHLDPSEQMPRPLFPLKISRLIFFS